jgi:hypothetical protein
MLHNVTFTVGFSKRTSKLDEILVQPQSELVVLVFSLSLNLLTGRTRQPGLRHPRPKYNPGGPLNVKRPALFLVCGNRTAIVTQP